MQHPSLLQNKQPGGSSGTGPARFPSIAVSSPGPDADINSNAGLLDVRADGDHFTYGQYNKPGSQSAQNAVPHFVQRMCRPLLLPHSKRVSYGNVPFALPRPHLQRGELAFCIRVGLESRLFDLCSRKDMIRHKAGSASDALINLHTLNYILRGIQVCISPAMDIARKTCSLSPSGLTPPAQVHKNKEEGWQRTFWNDFSMETVVGVRGMNMEDDRVIEAACTHVVSNCIRPFGIVKADEMKVPPPDVQHVFLCPIQRLNPSAAGVSERGRVLDHRWPRAR